MTTVLIDACGWVAVIDGGIHIDHALADQVGPVELAITPAGRAELERLQGERSATLLLDLLDSRAEVVQVNYNADSESARRVPDGLRTIIETFESTGMVRPLADFPALRGLMLS